MIVKQELHGLLEAVAIHFYCRGQGQGELLRGDEIAIAQRAIAPDLETSWQSLQALAAGIIAATIVTMSNQLSARGTGSIPLDVLGEMLERLPVQILDECEIELGDEVEVPEDEDEDDEGGDAA